MSIEYPLEEASLDQLQQTPIDNVLQIIDEGLVRLPTYRELYYRWERQQWKASEIDFTVDREQWQSMPQDERTTRLYGLASFFQGEASVTDALSPFIMAMPEEEMRLFMTTQQVDEARHTVFFARFFGEVMDISQGSLEETLTEVRGYMNEDLKFILIDSLEDIAQRLCQNPGDLALLVEGVTLYHVIVEATMALAGQRSILDVYRTNNLFPGFRGGFTAVARDESRHVVFGVKFLREMIQRDHDYARVVQATVEKYAPIGLRGITPGEQQIAQLLEAGTDPWLTPRYAQDSLRKKLKVVGLSMPLPEVPAAPAQ